MLVGAANIASAYAQDRSLTLYYTHTKETLTITYKRNGKFDQAALNKLNHFLRDWRENKSVRMDPALFDILWEVYRQNKATGPIHIVSAYRSPTTNETLRSRSRRVAKTSQHMRGKAIDFFIPSIDMRNVRVTGLKLQRGGVGWYPNSASKFVHLDTGSVRHWPRMTRPQLARVFPDGKTVHVPSDGKPMPRYAEAAKELARQGISPSATSVQFAEANGIRVPRAQSSNSGNRQLASSYDSNNPAAIAIQRGDSKGILALLFGDGEDDAEERSAAEPTSAPVAAASTTAVSLPAAPLPPSLTPAAVPEQPTATATIVLTQAPLPGANPFIARPALAEPTITIAEAPLPQNKPRGIFEAPAAIAEVQPPVGEPVDLASTGQDGTPNDAFDRNALVAYARDDSPQDRIEALLRNEAGINILDQGGNNQQASIENLNQAQRLDGYEWISNKSGPRPTLVGHNADWHFISPSKHETIDRSSVFAEKPLNFRLMRMDSPLTQAPEWVMANGFSNTSEMISVGHFSGVAQQAMRLKGPLGSSPTTTASIGSAKLTR
jgi:uncharacterized protein YcbK (DUF882 family)